MAWIAAQLERQQNAPVAQMKTARMPFWQRQSRVPYMAGAAALAAVLILGIWRYNKDSDVLTRSIGVSQGNFEPPPPLRAWAGI